MEMRLPPNLFERGGVWYVRKEIRGQRLRASTGVKVGGDAELRKAIAKQREIETRWEKGAQGVKATPTFGEWWEDYKATYSSEFANPDGDEARVGHVLPKWRHIRIDQITKSMCQRHLNERLKVVSQGTVTRERGTLQAMFARAIEDDYIEKNPFASIKRIRDDVRMRVLEWEEEAKLREVLTPQFQRWLTFMLGTGLRLNESRHVTPLYVDKQARTIEVLAEATKGKKGEKHGRLVPLSPQVEQAIEDQQQAFGRLWHANPQNYRDLLQRASTQAKIDHLWPHALRHTFATRYLQGGGEIYTLSKILGHESVTMTERVYVHLKKHDAVSLGAPVDVLTPPSKIVPFQKKQA